MVGVYGSGDRFRDEVTEAFSREEVWGFVVEVYDEDCYSGDGGKRWGWRGWKEESR